MKNKTILQFFIDEMGFTHTSGMITKLDYSYAMPDKSLSIVERNNIKIVVGIMGARHIEISILKDGKQVYMAPLTTYTDDKWKQAIAEIEKDSYYFIPIKTCTISHVGANYPCLEKIFS